MLRIHWIKDCEVLIVDSLIEESKLGHNLPNLLWFGRLLWALLLLQQ